MIEKLETSNRNLPMKLLLGCSMLVPEYWEKSLVCVKMNERRMLNLPQSWSPKAYKMKPKHIYLV